MTLEFILIFIMSAMPCVLTQISISISAPSIVKPSESAQVICHVHGVSITDGSKIHSVNFIRQFSGDRLEFLAHLNYGAGTAYNSLIQSRLSLSRNTDKNEVYLEFKHLGVDDSARYYCAAQSRGGSYDFDVWGKGTHVDVTTASPSGPSLFPLISCDTSQGQSTTIGCMARNFFPDIIEFSWADKANSSYVEDFKQFKLKSGSDYVASSQVKVQTVNWKKHDSFYCTVKHTSTNTVKTVKLQNEEVVAVPRKPIVTIHPPFKDDVEINGNATIACIVSGFFPNSIEVSWMKNHDLPTDRDTVHKGPVSDVNGNFMITSYITVSKHEWDTDVTFSCAVKHAPSDFHEIKNVSKSTVCDFQPSSGKIKVTVEPPSFETIYLQNIAPLACIISNMENKDGLEVSWYANKEKIPTVIEDPVYDSALQKYRARAIASVCPEDWRTKIFVCSVSHPELPQVTNVNVSKSNGQDARAPTILLFQPHQDELAKKETITLTCMVKGFYPKDIFVKWIDSDNIEHSNFITTEPKEEITSGKKKFFLISTLVLSSIAEWNNGKVYTCLVGHESLPLHITQKSIDKTSGKPTNMNVSLIMSDTC